MKDTVASFRTGQPCVQPLSFGQWPFYSDPREILLLPDLSTSGKREILSSWASDARAVPDEPALRRLDNGAMASIHDILGALKSLDAADLETCGPRRKESTPLRGRFPAHRWLPPAFRWRRSDDDDDGPPPCPAVIAPFPRLPPLGAEVGLEAA
jgi:hypothetical protein